MLTNLNIDDRNLTIYTNKRFNYTYESYTFPALYKNEKKIVKIIKDSNALPNKIHKIRLLKERLNSFNEVVTADCFITSNKIIVGYMMPYIEGENIFLPEYSNKELCIKYLKELSEMLKELHNLNIVNADFYNNIILNNNKLYFIDHDNFAIDNYPVDFKNVFLTIYQKKVKDFNKNFDNYLLNIYTICSLKNITPQCIYSLYKNKISNFNFRDKEISNIFHKTMNLDNIYNEELIIDKINSSKDLKKIKVKLF